MLASRVHVPRRAERRRMPGEEEPRCARLVRPEQCGAEPWSFAKAERTRGTFDAPRSEFASCTTNAARGLVTALPHFGRPCRGPMSGATDCSWWAHGMSAGLDVRAASRTEDTKEIVHLVDTKFYGLNPAVLG